MTDIQNELKEINKRFANIEKKLANIEKICIRMDKHISFIDNVYDSVEKPLIYVKNTIENLLKISNKTLPIKDYD